MTWNKVNGAELYNVIYKVNDKDEFKYTTIDTNFDFSKILVPDAFYSVSIEAVNDSGKGIQSTEEKFHSGDKYKYMSIVNYFLYINIIIF